MIKTWLFAKNYVFKSNMVFLLKLLKGPYYKILSHPYWQDRCHGLNIALNELFSFTQGAWPCNRKSSKTCQRTQTRKGWDVGQTWPPDWRGAVGPPGSPAWPAQPCPCTSCVTKHHETSRHTVSKRHKYSSAYLCAFTLSMSVWGTACVNSMEVLRMSSSCGRLTGRLFSAFRNLSGGGVSLLSVLFIWGTLVTI